MAIIHDVWIVRIVNEIMVGNQWWYDSHSTLEVSSPSAKHQKKTKDMNNLQLPNLTPSVVPKRFSIFLREVDTVHTGMADEDEWRSREFRKSWLGPIRLTVRRKYPNTMDQSKNEYWILVSHVQSRRELRFQRGVDIPTEHAQLLHFLCGQVCFVYVLRDGLARIRLGPCRRG